MSREPRVVYRARRIQHEEPAAVWVESDRTPTGAYRATIHPTPDVDVHADGHTLTTGHTTYTVRAVVAVRRRTGGG